MASPEAEPVPGPKKKRLPFKRTVPRQAPVEKAADGDSENNDIEFFRRTNDIMPMVLQDMNRSPTPEKKPAPHKKGSFHLSPDKRERKRVKISPDSDECDRVNKLPAPASASKKPAAVSLSDDSDSEDLIIDVKGKGKEIFYRTPTKRKISNPRASSASALRLTDSDDDVKPTRTPSRPPETPTPHKTRPPPRGPGSDRRHASPVLLDLDDDEKPDVKLQLADLDADSSDSDFIELTGPPDPKEENNDDELAYWIQQAKTLEEETQNVIVTVIVTSRIAGTKPVMIRRRLNQVIRPVLETWIDRQRSHDIDVPEDVERGMFLTWKGHKVYSSSTLASLGIPVDPATGTVKPSRDGGFRQDMLHIEVWTEEAWAGHLRETEQQRKLQIGIYDDDSGGDGAANPAAKDELAVAEEKYNVRLKSQDQMIPCTISPSYRVKEIIEMFREVAKLGEDRDISIWFDGEQLDEDALAVEAAELEPDEISQLEVRVK